MNKDPVYITYVCLPDLLNELTVAHGDGTLKKVIKAWIRSHEFEFVWIHLQTCCGVYYAGRVCLESKGAWMGV